MKTKILDINCRFCGEKGGEIEVADHRAECEWQIQNANAQIENRERAFNSLDKSEMTPADIATEKKSAVDFIIEMQRSVSSYKELLSSLPETDPRHTATFHYEDHRCEKCAALHGDYKEMGMRAVNAGIGKDAFKEIMEKTGYKDVDLEKHFIRHKNKS